MKKILFAALAAAMCACAPKVTVTVENTLPIDRTAQLVEIPVADLGAVALADGQTWVVSRDGQVVPSQLTHDGLIIFQSGLGAGEKATFTVKAGAPQEFPAKTKGRFAPERMDDFIWENDRVAFRIYGAALVAKDGPSNGIDALYKRTDEMILDKWYEDYFAQPSISYHDDNGTGLDNFDVKRTLGAGGAAPFINDTLLLNSNFTGQELLDNGPLRTTFRLTYPQLVINGAPASETRTISIDAGSQLSRVVQEWGVTAPITAAVGFTMRNPDVRYTANGNTLMVEEPATRAASGVFLGAVLPEEFAGAVENEYVNTDPERTATYRLVLATQNYTPGTPLTYYTGFGWEKWGGWNAESFNQYLTNFAASRRTPFIITIK
jgi:hypothetical protein